MKPFEVFKTRPSLPPCMPIDGLPQLPDHIESFAHALDLLHRIMVSKVDVPVYNREWFDETYHCCIESDPVADENPPLEDVELYALHLYVLFNISAFNTDAEWDQWAEVGEGNFNDIEAIENLYGAFAGMDQLTIPKT